MCVLLLPLHTRLSGASGARHSLRPLIGGREIYWQASGDLRREIANVYPDVIASEAKQSSFGAAMKDGLLRRFAPRNDGLDAIIFPCFEKLDSVRGPL